MSDAIGKTGCISHRPNSHFFIIHEDFLDVAKVSEHQYKLAAFWRVLETKHNERKIYNDELVAEYQKKGLPEPATSMWIEIPYSEFEHRTLGTYKSSSFKIAAAESERLGFSQSRVQKRATNPLDPQSPKVDYKEYLFNVEAMQTVLNTGVYPTPVEFDSPLLKGYQDREKKRKESKTPVENDSPPVENDTGKAKTPVENDTPPLSNSTANNIYIGSSFKDNNIKTTNDAHASRQLRTNSQKGKSSGRTNPPKEKKPVPPTQAELPKLDEPDLSILTEKEQDIYHRLLRNEDQPKYLAWPVDMRNVYNSLLGKYGYTVPINITPKVEECMKQLKDEHPTTEMFKEVDKYAHKHDQYYPDGKKKPVEKQYYKGRGLKPWDYVREWAAWKSQIGQTSNNPQSSTTPASGMTHDDAIQLAADVVTQGKEHGMNIQARAISTNSDAWIVSATWDGEKLQPITSRELWKKYFAELRLTAEDYAAEAQKKGAK